MSSSDDELILCSAAVIVLTNNRKRKRRWWVKTILKKRAESSLLTDLRMEDTSGFKNFTRMSPCDFELLLNLVGPRVAGEATNFRKCITVVEKLAVTLRFLATGDSFQSLMYLFSISKQSISAIVPKVCEALIDGLKNSVKVSLFHLYIHSKLLVTKQYNSCMYQILHKNSVYQEDSLMNSHYPMFPTENSPREVY